MYKCMIKFRLIGINYDGLLYLGRNYDIFLIN